MHHRLFVEQTCLHRGRLKREALRRQGPLRAAHPLCGAFSRVELNPIKLAYERRRRPGGRLCQERTPFADRIARVQGLLFTQNNSLRLLRLAAEEWPR